MAGEPFWRRYLRLLGPDVDGDVDDEIGFHLSRLEADLRARGVPEPEIAAAVRRRFGDVDAVRRELRRQDRRRHTRARRVEWRTGLWRDVRLALRRTGQDPGFTAAILVVLGLGIGATTAMFSAVDAAVLRPLPFPAPDRLVVLNGVTIPFRPGATDLPRDRARFLDISDVRGMPGAFAATAGYASGGLNLSDPEGPVRLAVGVVTSGFFKTLGVGPLMGRTFTAEEGAPGGRRVVVLSWGFWQRRFGGTPVVGQELRLNRVPYTVVGVMPRGFTFPRRSDLWLPLTVPSTFETFEPFRGYLPSHVIARLADGVTPASAEARLRAGWNRVASLGDDSVVTARARGNVRELEAEGLMVPLQRGLAGDRRTALWVLLGATGLLLLIACVNVTNLLLSRAALRRREIAIRGVLGASGGRIVRQLLVESLVLSLAGAALGLAVAPLVLRAMGTLLPPALRDLAPAQLDLRVLGFAALLAVVTGLAFGIWPALGSVRTSPAETITTAGVRGGPGGAGRARRALVGIELGLTVMLLVGAGVMLRSFTRLMDTAPGLVPDHAATLEMSFAAGTDRAARLRTIDAALVRLAGYPGVTAAGVVNDLPLAGQGGISVTIQAGGRSTDASGEPLFARFLQASGGYFPALGIPLIRGRLFTAADDTVAPAVAIVNQTMARTLWPDRDPIGQVFGWPPQPGTRDARFTVVGVVGDIRDHSLDAEPTMQMYFPVHAMTPGNVALIARGSLPSAQLLAALRQAVREADPHQAVYAVRMMDEVVSASVAPRRTNTLLISAFGGLALLLAALGVYGVVAYSVVRRAREFGIRVALGATGAQLLGAVVGEMLWVTLLGLAAGLAGAWAGSRVLQSLVYDVSVRDPATFLVAPAVLLVPVAIAILVPARRSLAVNPMEVMREE